MKMLNYIKEYFTGAEIIIWSVSSAVIILSFCIFDRENYLTLLASMVGVTSLIFIAKGNPAGQLLMVIFSSLYAVISYNYSYYGEMVTYLGMGAPMAVFTFISWLRNPYKDNKSEVKVNSLSKIDIVLMIVLTVLVTQLFYYILKFFNTANLVPSTISITTSFLGVYLMFRRSPYYALAFVLNDIVLICLWILASFDNIQYISVTVCFAAFLVNDMYGYLSWRKMKVRQNQN